MATLNRRDYYAAIPQLEGKLSNLSKYITVTEGKIQIKIEDLYGNVSTLTQTAEDLTLEISEERTERKMLIRSFIGGTITAYQGNAYGVYTNASGSVDIVTLAWSGSTPSITGTLASYGSTTIIGNRSGTYWEFAPDGLFWHHNGDTEVSDIAFASMMGSGYTVVAQTIYGTSQVKGGSISGSSLSVSGSISGGSISGSSVSASGSVTGNKIYTRNPSYGSSETANARIITASSPYEIGFISNGSSRDLKHDIKSIEMEDIDPHRLYDAEVVQFVYNDDYLNKDDRRYGRPIPGFIAEDLMEVYPMAVDVEDGKAKTWNERYIIPPMLALIQEQNERIKELERRIECLNESTR